MDPGSGAGTPVFVSKPLNRVPGLARPRENGEHGIHLILDRWVPGLRSASPGMTRIDAGRYPPLNLSSNSSALSAITVPGG